MDRFLEDGVSEEEVNRWVRSASFLHSNGDALDIAVKAGRIVGVRGRAVDRVNRGRLDPKGLFGWQANNSEDRLEWPLVRRNGELVEARWDEAMERIMDRSPWASTPRGSTSWRSTTPWGHRESRARDAAHGRKHAAVHGHLGPGPQ